VRLHRVLHTYSEASASARKQLHNLDRGRILATDQTDKGPQHGLRHGLWCLMCLDTRETRQKTFAVGCTGVLIECLACLLVGSAFVLAMIGVDWAIFFAQVIIVAGIFRGETLGAQLDSLSEKCQAH
jgi:hypothetical protein